MKILSAIGRFLGRTAQGVLIGIVTVATMAGVIAYANYSLTQGSGTTFASVVISSTHYVANLLCDATAGATQCAGVNSSGQVAIQAPPSLPLPTGAATSALQTTGNSTLSTINSTLGSPFQASGSIGNTGFNALQGGSANAVGNPFYVSPGTGATFTVAGSVTATGAATAANQTNAGQKTQIVDGSGNVIASTSNALNVNCTGCSAATTVSTNWIQLAGTTLAGPSNYGTAPSGEVQGVNAYVTNAATPDSNTGAIAGTSSCCAPTVAFGYGNANSSEPSKATTTYWMGLFTDLVGKLVNSPYANRENYVRGSVSLTSTGTNLALIGAQGANVKIYLTDLQCFRNDAGTTALTVSTNDVLNTGTNSVWVLADNGGGGGFVKPGGGVPLVFAANTTAYVDVLSSAAVTNSYCNAQGYTGY